METTIERSKKAMTYRLSLSDKNCGNCNNSVEREKRLFCLYKDLNFWTYRFTYCDFHENGQTKCEQKNK